MGQEQSVSSKRRRSARRIADDYDDANNSDEGIRNRFDGSRCEKGKNDEKRLSIETNSSNTEICNVSRKRDLQPHNVTMKREESRHQEEQSKKENRAKERRLSHHRRESTKNSVKESKHAHRNNEEDKTSLRSTVPKISSKSDNYDKITERSKMRKLSCNNEVNMPVKHQVINVISQEAMGRKNKTFVIPTQEITNPLCSSQINEFAKAKQQFFTPTTSINTIGTIEVNNDTNANCRAMSATETELPCSRPLRGCNRVFIANAGKENLLRITIPDQSMQNTNNSVGNRNNQNNIYHGVDGNTVNRNIVNNVNYNNNSSVSDRDTNKNNYYCVQQPFQPFQSTISPVATPVIGENAGNAHLQMQPNPLNQNSLHNESQDRLSSSVRRKRVNSVVTVTDNSIILTDNNNTAVPPFMQPLPSPPRVQEPEQRNTIPTGSNNQNEMVGQSTLQDKKRVSINNDNKLVDNTPLISNNTNYVNNYNEKNVSVLPSPSPLATLTNNPLPLSSTRVSMPSLNRPNCKNKSEQPPHVINERQQQLMSNGVLAVKKNNNNNSLPVVHQTQNPQRQQHEVNEPSCAEPKGILNRKSSYSNMRRHSFCAGQEFAENDKDIAERLAKRDKVLSAYQIQPREEVAMKKQHELVEAQIHATARIRANNYTDSNIEGNVENVNSSFVSQELYDEQQPLQQQQQQQISNNQHFLPEVEKHTAVEQPFRYTEQNMLKDYTKNAGDNRNCNTKNNEHMFISDDSNNNNNNNCRNADITKTEQEESKTHMPMLILYEIPLRFRRSSFLTSSSKTESSNDASNYPVKTYGEDCTEIKVCTNIDSSETSKSATTYKVDELIAHRRASTAIDSVLVNNVKSYFVNGYPTCLFGLDSPSLVHGTSALESPTSLLIEKLISDVIADMKGAQNSNTKAESELEYYEYEQPQYQWDKRQEEELQPENCTTCELYCAMIAVVNSDMEHANNTCVDLLTEYQCKDKDQGRYENRESVLLSKNKYKNSVHNSERELGQHKQLTSAMQETRELPSLHFTSVESIGLQLDNVTYRKVDDEETFVSMFSEAQAKANEFINAEKDKFASNTENETVDCPLCYYYVVSCLRVQGEKRAVCEMRETIKNNSTNNNIPAVNDCSDNDSDEHSKEESLMEKLCCSTTNVPNIDSSQQKYHTIENANVLEKPNLSLHISDNELVLSTLTCVTVEDRGQHFDRALTKAKELIVQRQRQRQENLRSTTRDNKMVANSKLNVETDLLTELFTMPWYGVSVAGIDPRNSDANDALHVQHTLAYNKEFSILSQQGFVKEKCSQLLLEISALKRQISSNPGINKSHFEHLINRKRSQLHAIRKLLCTEQ